jgi:SAM-dependent methyltransferase
MYVLNLGCGMRPNKTGVNHDLHKHHPFVDVAHDLNILPWPWADETFDAIKAWSVFEHLSRERVSIIDECWRILKPGGLLVVKLPYWKNEQAHDDITHYWFTNLHQFDQFDPTTERGEQYGFYTPFPWKLESSKFSNRGHSSIVHKLRKMRLSNAEN